MLYRLTKDSTFGLNNNNNNENDKSYYRVSQRPALHLIKCLFGLAIIIFPMIIFIIDNRVVYDLFYKMDKNTNNIVFLRLGATTVCTFYMFELICDRGYKNMNIPKILHHIFAIYSALLYVIFDNFLPFIIWYGVFGVGFIAFINGIPFTLRYSKYTSSYFNIRLWKNIEINIVMPNIIRILFLIATLNYILVGFGVNLIGQIFLIYRAFVTQNVELYQIIMIIIFIFVWIYDDIKLLKALIDSIFQEYEASIVLNDFQDKMSVPKILTDQDVDKLLKDVLVKLFKIALDSAQKMQKK